MKNLLLSALLVAGCSVFAAERAPHFEAALARAKSAGKDIVVFQRGSDWNRLSERLHTDLWLKSEFAETNTGTIRPTSGIDTLPSLTSLIIGDRR